MPIQKPPKGDSKETELTPLERYLAKKKGDNDQAKAEAPLRNPNKADSVASRFKMRTDAEAERPKSTDVTQTGSLNATKAGLGSNPAVDQASVNTNNLTDAERRAIEQGVPLAPPLPREGGHSEVPPPNQPPVQHGLKEVELAGFGARFVAFVIDGVILKAVHSSIETVLFGALGFVLGGYMAYVDSLMSRLLFLVLIYFYYGWFYSQKGASPGKLLLGLQVVKSDTGKRLTYWQAFFRESIGKFVSGAILGLGYLIAAFREDRRALHDMIFDTRVIEKPN